MVISTFSRMKRKKKTGSPIQGEINPPSHPVE